MELRKVQNKKAAMEMSMGTIVTIVLVVVTLVLALILIRSIFSSGTSAVDQINNAIQDQINKLFSSESTDVAIYPADLNVPIKRGDSTPRGFAFAVKNPDNTLATFSYTVTAQSLYNCGSLTKDEANSYIVNKKGSFTAGAGAISDIQVVRFLAPKSAPACTITYSLIVNDTNNPNFGPSKPIFVNLK